MATQQNTSKKPSTSVRKVEANRRNALKSTGPRSLTGKVYSRRNALKHGLFARDLFSDFVVQREDPKQFQELHAQLRKELQPHGRAEELEVEYIAVCWWRRGRLWRYENAEMRTAQFDLKRNARDVSPGEIMTPGQRTLKPLLEEAQEQIMTSGEISPQLNERILAADPSFPELWSRNQELARRAIAQAQQEEAGASTTDEESMEQNPDDRLEPDQLLAIMSAKFMIYGLEHWAEHLFKSLLNNAFERRAIPNTDALDRILRYGGVIERDLNRAYDRLDRLQRRRKGELVPPSLTVNLA
jgi:hypothetical protein